MIACSGNIIKNAKSVVVPMTGSLKGIEAAAVTGTVGGDPGKELEVLTGVTSRELEKVQNFLKRKYVRWNVWIQLKNYTFWRWFMQVKM